MSVKNCRYSATQARFRLENILDHVTNSDPSVTDYVWKVPAKCLQCGGTITEKTLVEPA
jgi:hypothetical protein